MHIKAKKHLGQHFLKDESVSRRVAEGLTGHGGYKHLVEVGPGTGALTQHLLQLPGLHLTCYEVDAESVEFLTNKYPDLEVRESDFLRMDPDSITDGQIAVVGNFPYNISSQIVFKVLEHRDQFPELVGMFQKEVADRFCSGPGNRTYGITSVLSQAWYDMEVLFVVEPDAFNPPPKVRSAVIRMRRNTVTELACDEKLLARVVKMAFNQRRKTLHNALKSLQELPNGVPSEYASKRAEQLSVADFIALTLACEVPGPGKKN